MNSKLNEMYPNASAIFLRIKNNFEKKPIKYEVSESIFDNYKKVDYDYVRHFRIYYEYIYITESNGYSIYKLFI